MKKNILATLLAMAICSLSIFSSADKLGPREQLIACTNQVMTTLKNTEGQNDVQRLETLKKNFIEMFLIKKVALYALGSQRKNFTDKEFSSFSDCFFNLLVTLYHRKISASYREIQINFGNEKFLTKNSAIVRTVITKDGVDTTVDYSMSSADGTWRVYDVKIEGISMIANYRRQFAGAKNAKQILSWVQSQFGT